RSPTRPPPPSTLFPYTTLFRSSGPAFGDRTWFSASADDKRNSVWSVRLAPGGSFDPSDVRREFLLPDFFMQSQDIDRAGYSQPVDRTSTRLNSSHVSISYAVFC